MDKVRKCFFEDEYEDFDDFDEEMVEDEEEEINNLEQLQTTDEVINDYEKYNEITAQIEEKNNQLEEKMEEWEALNE